MQKGVPIASCLLYLLPIESFSSYWQLKSNFKSSIILIAFSGLDGKVGVSGGVTKDLSEKFDAVELVKIAASTLGGKGGGGRKDFAQAGGIDETKIEDAYKAVLKKIS